MMKKTHHILLTTLVTLLFCFCSEPHLDTLEYTPKIAIDGFIEAGKPPVMYLSYSSPFISSYDSMDFVDMVKFNVSAYVITEENDTIGFTRKTATDHFPPFKYTMSRNDLIAEAGKSYQLLVQKKGMEDITATTLIPQEVPIIEAIAYNPTTETYGNYTLKIKNSNHSLYYFIQNKIKGEDSFYPITFPCKSNRLFDTNETMHFTVQYRKKTNLWQVNKPQGETTSTTPSGTYNPADSIYFKVSSISKRSYEVMSSIFLDTEFPDNPFKPISQLPTSNVSNGIGHWTGIHSKVYMVNGEQ